MRGTWCGACCVGQTLRGSLSPSLLTDERPGARPLYVLQLQSTVLAIASPGHLQQHCARLRAQGAHQAPPRGRPWFQFWRPRTQRAYSYKLVLEPGEPQGIPRAVLCHLHTGQLPDDPEQLIWVSASGAH